MLVSAHVLARLACDSGRRAEARSTGLLADSVAAWGDGTPSWAERPALVVGADEARGLSPADVGGRALVVFSPDWPVPVPDAVAPRCMVTCRHDGTARELAAALWAQTARLSYHHDRACEALSEERPLGELLDVVASYLGVPLCLVDSDLSVLAMSGGAPQGPRGLWDLLASGGRPDGLAQWLAERFSHGNLPVELGADGDGHVLACSVFRPSATLGHLLAFFGPCEPDEADRDLATLFSSLLAQAVALRQSSERPVGSRAEELFAGALEGSAADAQALERHAVACDLALGSHLQLATLLTCGESVSDAYLQRLARQFREACSPLLCVATSDFVAGLFSAHGADPLDARREGAVEAFARANALRAGVSRACPSLADVPRMCAQALAAVEQGAARHPDGRLFRFADYAFDHLRQVLSSHGPLDAFCEPGVMALGDYDAAHGSELLLTVRTYLECDKSPSRTAAELNVHRSTLDYRIRRAEEVMGLDLSDPDDHFSAWLSLRLLEP